MIDDVRGGIDYEECGTGSTIVLVPRSCSTGAAWRPVMAAWGGQFRCVTTSLLGYGGTAERRTKRDPSIDLEVDALEAVIHRANGGIHLVAACADLCRRFSDVPPLDIGGNAAVSRVRKSS